jgi:hypothetical protein
MPLSSSTLKLLFDDIVADEAVDGLLSVFRVVDLTRLRSLDVGMGTPLLPLLKASSRTVKKVRYSFPPGLSKPFSSFQTLTDGSAGEHSDANILENNTSLHHIDVTASNNDMADTLKVFGDLGHLMALRTLSLHFANPIHCLDANMGEEEWRALDEVLTQAGDSLKAVQIYAHMDKNYKRAPDLALLCELLPSVARKISLYPTDSGEGDEYEDTDEEDGED